VRSKKRDFNETFLFMADELPELLTLSSPVMPCGVTGLERVKIVSNVSLFLTSKSLVIRKTQLF
jgi:hypothetical protein